MDPLIAFEHLSLYIQKHLGGVTTNSKPSVFFVVASKAFRHTSNELVSWYIVISMFNVQFQKLSKDNDIQRREMIRPL